LTSVKKLIIKKYLQNQNCGSIYRSSDCQTWHWNWKLRKTWTHVPKTVRNHPIGRQKDTWANWAKMRHLSQKISCWLEIETWNRPVGAEKWSTVVSLQEKKSWTYECNSGKTFQTCENSAKLARGYGVGRNFQKKALNSTKQRF
jgi:hypothetical protein